MATATTPSTSSSTAKKPATKAKPKAKAKAKAKAKPNGGTTLSMGTYAKDKCTGLRGVLTARLEYHYTQQVQFLVQPPVKKDGTIVEAQWVEAQRLQSIGGRPAAQ